MAAHSEKYIPKEYSTIDLAYLAGIIDGEGCVFIGNFSCNAKFKTPYFQTLILVSNTDKALIDWLYKTFGGSFIKYTRAQTPKNSRKEVFKWSIQGERLTHIGEVVLPFLICKKNQVEILLKMRYSLERVKVQKGKYGIQRLPDEVILYRQSLMDELRSLHTRTYSYKKHGHLPRVTIHPTVKDA